MDESSVKLAKLLTELSQAYREIDELNAQVVTRDHDLAVAVAEVARLKRLLGKDDTPPLAGGCAYMHPDCLDPSEPRKPCRCTEVLAERTKHPAFVVTGLSNILPESGERIFLNPEKVNAALAAEAYAAAPRTFDEEAERPETKDDIAKRIHRDRDADASSERDGL